MPSMAVISTDDELNDRVKSICQKFAHNFQLYCIANEETAIEFLQYDMPEIALLNYSEGRIDISKILDTIRNNPWLHYAGLIIVHKSSEQKMVWKAIHNLNVISCISRGNFVRDFSFLLHILIKNRRILVQQSLQQNLMDQISGSLAMENDPVNVRLYSSLIPTYLYSSGYINMESAERLQSALFEIFMNAVEHGNCNISYEEKTGWLETHGDILTLIEKLNKDPKIKKRRVYFTYHLSPECSSYTIRDDGKGFDWRSRTITKSQEPTFHGYGIKMAEFYVGNLKYNDKGNEVSFEFVHKPDIKKSGPNLYRNENEIIFQDGDVIFTEGDLSDHMHYIVSGNFDIYRNNVLVARLGGNDLFLGELSFLLSHRRNATVKSRGESRLIEISRMNFVKSIQSNPHYGILFSRLLAKRLTVMNEYTMKLKTAIQHFKQQGHSEALNSQEDKSVAT